MTDYTNDAQQRLCRLVVLLFADVVNGLAPSQLAKELGCTSTAMTRDLFNLVKAGLAEKTDSGLYRLTPRLPQQAVKVFAAINAAETRLSEARQRYGAAS